VKEKACRPKVLGGFGANDMPRENMSATTCGGQRVEAGRVNLFLSDMSQRLGTETENNVEED
jgi:hypothetical protein